jgi:hypothetical protein
MVTGSPDDNPAFLDPERATSIGYVGGEDPPTFDHELLAKEIGDGETIEPMGKGPSRGYQERHRAIARLHALGYTNNQIARRLGYSATGISLALQSEFVQAETERFRTQYFETDIVEALKSIGPDAINHIHRTILDESEKSELRSTNARWAVEKLTGKAKQEVTVEHGLSSYMDILRDMRSRGEIIDVSGTPVLETASPEADPGTSGGSKWKNWLNSNLGTVG